MLPAQTQLDSLNSGPQVHFAEVKFLILVLYKAFVFFLLFCFLFFFLFYLNDTQIIIYNV